MHKIVIAPDSFKGTLSSFEVCEIIKKAASAVYPKIDCRCVPVADGGEGTVDALGASHIDIKVTGPHFESSDSYYGRLGDTAVIELATAAGLPMTDPLNPEKTTTYGVGELIKDALDRGFRKFIIALGGSSTNDCGCGMAAALGVRFTDKDGNAFIPVGGTLSDVAKIDMSGIDMRIAESDFQTMCDIDNPLYGENGASYVFSPQKGADKDAVLRLDSGLRSIAGIIKRDIGTDVSVLPGAGAAGGCGAGTVAFLSSVLKRGINVVLDIAKFEDMLDSCDAVITGEGKFDSQSVFGKAISGIANRTKKKNIPLIVFCGCAEETEISYEMGVSAVFSIQRKAMPLEKAMKYNASGLYKTAYNVFSLLKSVKK